MCADCEAPHTTSEPRLSKHAQTVKSQATYKNAGFPMIAANTTAKTDKGGQWQNAHTHVPRCVALACMSRFRSHKPIAREAGCNGCTLPNTSTRRKVAMAATAGFAKLSKQASKPTYVPPSSQASSEVLAPWVVTTNDFGWMQHGRSHDSLKFKRWRSLARCID